MVDGNCPYCGAGFEDLQRLGATMLCFNCLKHWEIQPLTYDDALDAAVDELLALLKAKHHDYGPANLSRYGEFGILVRASDKVTRLENALRHKTLVAEDREETWLDLAGYALQAVLSIRGQLTLPSEKLPFDEDEA